jgi:hypothetical protein
MRRTFAVILAVFSLAIPFARANTFLVINTADGGTGSLRQAIVDANNNPGFDTIAFAIPGVFVHTIHLIDDLPTIFDQVLIDGYTEPGSSQNTLANGDNAVLLIEIDASQAPGGVNVILDLNTGSLGSTVRGLVINGAAPQNNAIAIFIASAACVVEGCFIGTDPTGTIARPNGHGISMIYGDGCRIGGTTPAARNIISGNTIAGISTSVSETVLIQGNFIGVNASGTSALPNANGVELTGCASNANCTGAAFIGSSNAGARNIISGNNLNGIVSAFGGVSHSFIQGNFIGTDVTGTLALGNGQNGIALVGSSGTKTGSNQIGGTQAGQGNVISANAGAGVYLHALDDQSEINDQVQGNFIGTGAGGSIAMSNGGGGILIDHASDAGIGGTAAGAGNRIAYNGSSSGKPGVVVLGSTGNSILGNSISVMTASRLTMSVMPIVEPTICKTFP